MESTTSPIVDFRLGEPLTLSFAVSGIQSLKISKKYEVMRMKSSLMNSYLLMVLSAYGFTKMAYSSIMKEDTR